MMKKKQPAPIYNGQFEYHKVNKATGEVVEVGDYDEFKMIRAATAEDNSPKRGGNNFAILYLLEFYNLLDELGTKKMAVVRYIVENMGYDNTLIKTAKDIAAETGISDKTVRVTLQRLEAANLITRKPSVIMLNPQLINRKNAAGERSIMVKFEGIKQDKEKHTAKKATDAEN